MDLRLKLGIDHYVGGCLAWLLNLAARLVALFWKRDHTLRHPPRTVLFLKFTGLGSIARAAFLLPAVRERFPNCRLAFACFPGCAGLVRMYAQVDDVLIVRDANLFGLAIDTLRLVLWSWRRRVQLVIDLEVHSKYSSVVAGLTLARDRAGFGGITSRFRRGLYTHLTFWNPIRRVDLAYRQLGRALGLSPTPHWVRPVLPPTARAEVARLCAELGIRPGDRVLGVNPNASELRQERRWPGEGFAKVIESLPARPDFHVLLLGSPAERDYAEHVRSLIGRTELPVWNVAGALGFAGFAALLERLTVLLTNDSGPLHIAAALGTPTVSLWGPGHPQHYTPHGAKHVVFYRPIYCSPCIYTTDVPPCGGDNQCLRRLDWRAVARAVCRMLHLEGPPAARVAPRTSVLNEPVPVFGYWQRASVPLPVPRPASR